MKEKLKLKPFYLSDEDIKWVEKTKENMSLDEKVAQLFCLIAYTSDEGYLNNLVHNIKPGGLMCRVMPTEDVVKTVSILQQSKIPMLISANIEKGGNGIVTEGTYVGAPLNIGATNDKEMAYKLGVVCGAEGNAVGANWTFAPVIDIDYNFRNPITNTRTFGSNPEIVRDFGAEFVKGVQENDVAACIKHFPGDGIDERDQHLVTTVNTMKVEEWEKTFGDVYRKSIEEGALSCMIGHIALPEYSKVLDPTLKDEDILPATLAKEITTTLLREKLGFNGLVVTDATAMAGFALPMPREKAVPTAIAAGCDMFLFTRNMDEDFYFMKKGIEEGVITSERLDEALTRILGMKAALKLHTKQQNNELAPNLERAKEIIGNPKHQEWAKECADKSITLVKEEKGVLPISVEKHKRVLFYNLENTGSFFDGNNVTEEFRKLLENEGFEIEVFNANKGMEGMMTPSKDVLGKYDLIIYVANIITKSNQTTVRIEWAMPMGINIPIYLTSIPTIFVSVENPYHLLDIPRVKTYINAYSSGENILKEIVEKLMGRSEFKGTNPVDPFCGKWDTRL